MPFDPYEMRDARGNRVFQSRAEAKAVYAVHARRTVRCHWCDRVCDSKGSGTRLAETRDHVIPASLGGKATVKACYACNQLKGDLTPERWKAFMAAYPGWWKSFRTNREVTQALRGLTWTT